MKFSLSATLGVVAMLAATYLFLERIERRDETTGSAVQGEGAAPAFDLPLAGPSGSDARVRLADFAGAPVVLNFWASWCGACIEERPQLVALGERQGFEILGIASFDQPGDVLDAEKHRPHGHRVAIDGSNVVAERYGVRSLPTTVVVGGDGGILRRYGRALRDNDVAEIAALIAGAGT